MGLMKQELEARIVEFASKIGATEQQIYDDEFLYALAEEYTDRIINKNIAFVLAAAKFNKWRRYGER